MRKIFGSFMLFTLLISCEQTFEIDSGISFTPQIAVHGMINTDSTIKVLVYETMKVDVDYFEITPIGDADVQIFEDDVLLGKLKETSTNFDLKRIDLGGNYELDYVPIAGKTYRIEIKKDGFEPAWAETTISLAQSQFEVEKITNNEFAFTIEDVDGAEFYEILLTQQIEYIDNTEEERHIYSESQIVPFQSVSDLFEGKESYETLGYDGEVFSNDLFQEHPFKFSISPFAYRAKTYWDVLSSTMLIEIRTVTKDLYYHKSSQDFVVGIFGSPTQVHQNVNGGVGIFTGYNSRSVEFDVTSY